jgi:limonene-1,2-epoxide hydrolase
LAQEENDNVAAIRAYMKAIEDRATPAAVARFLTPDVVHEQFPNLLVPRGARANLAAMLAAAERGLKSVTRQRYEIKNVLAVGNQVAMEVRWVGTLAVPLGSIPAGGEMRAEIGMFFEMEEGKIKVQREYTCFEPF